MTRITSAILLTAALSTALTAGLAPAAARAETATASPALLVTTKSDSGIPNPRLAMILASINDEDDG